MFKSSAIAPQDRVPFFQKLMFSIGVNTDYVATALLTGVLWMPFFNIGLGMSPAVLGLVLMAYRAWDAITDPVVGNWSDNARTRWGRRRPFMFVGAITTALLFPLIWFFPEGLAESGSWMMRAADALPLVGEGEMVSPRDAVMAIYLLVVGCVFFTSFTCWSMPYYGMQLELTPNYDERTRLTAWMTFCGSLGNLIGSWVLAGVFVVGMLAVGDAAVFENKPAWIRALLEWLAPAVRSLSGAGPDAKPVVVGTRLLCWLIAILILVLGLLPALFVKERYYRKEAVDQPKEPFWSSVRASLACRPLWSLISISFFLVLGSMAVGNLSQYLIFYYVCGGDLALGAFIGGMKGSVLVVVGLLALPFYTWLGERFDKRSVVLAMLGVTMTGHLMNLILMTPEHPYLMIIPGIFESCAVSAIWLFLPSMKGDVADWDELRTHRRREGSINSFYSWFIKASLTCAMGVGGFVLQFSGFDAAQEVQPDHVLSSMFNLFLYLPLGIWGIAWVSAWLFPLNRARALEIRAALEARRGVI